MPFFVASRYVVFITMPIFVAATIFMFSPRCHLLLRQDIFVFIAMPFFYCATIFLFSPRCLLLLRHDIYEFTAMPAFCCTTILCDLHELLSLERG
jgi:hypothetical protein